MDRVTSRVKFTEERKWGDDPTPWKLRIVWGRPVQLVRSTVMPEWWVGLLCAYFGVPGGLFELRRRSADPLGKHRIAVSILLPMPTM